MKSLYNKKRGRARFYKDNCFQLINSNLQYIHFNLTQEDTVTGPTHPCRGLGTILKHLHFSSSRINALRIRDAYLRAEFGTQPLVKSVVY